MAYSHSHTVEAVKELMLARAHYYSPNSWTSLLRASNKPSIGRLAEAAGVIFNYSQESPLKKCQFCFYFFFICFIEYFFFNKNIRLAFPIDRPNLLYKKKKGHKMLLPLYVFDKNEASKKEKQQFSAAFFDRSEKQYQEQLELAGSVVSIRIRLYQAP